MCGACGEPATVDWARPWFANLTARTAAATAVLRLTGRPGLRVTPRSGGWLVTAPTGASTACGGLTELVAAVRPWGPALPELPTSSSGVLSIPPPDRRRGVVLRVGADGGDFATPDDAAARRLLARLAAPPWSLRYYLRDVTGTTAAWGGQPETLTGDPASVVVWLEWARQVGALDDRAVAARCPLGKGHELDVEIRAGHVVRARTRLRRP